MRHDHVAKLTMQVIFTDWQARAEAVERKRRLKGESVRRAVPRYVRETVFRNGWAFRMMEDGSVSKVLD